MAARIFWACILTIAWFVASDVWAASHYIDFGPADPLAVDQPRVAVEIYEMDPHRSLGPEFANTFLLDTGAQANMAVGYAVTELESNGYQTVAQFEELGLGGTALFDVSAEYGLDFAGTSGFRQTLGPVRILSDSSVNFGGFSGIIGSPGMLNRVTTLDMTNMLGGEFGWDYMGVDFGTAVPASTGHRYSVPVDLVEFPPTGQINPGDPLPTYGPLMFVDAELRSAAGGSATAPFVLDTGASLSLLSTAAAIDMGVDANGNGVLDESEILGYTELAGVAGSVIVPLVGVDELVLPTSQGVDLLWRELELPVYDIDPSIGGIFGCELLTTGWFDGVFYSGQYGAIEQIHLDLTDPASMLGEMFLDLNPLYDVSQAYPAIVGDADRDGDVDLTDLAILASNWNQPVTGDGWAQGDFSDNGLVDLIDLAMLAGNWGATMAAVPEPTSALLLSACLLGIRVYRRR